MTQFSIRLNTLLDGIIDPDSYPAVKNVIVNGLDIDSRRISQGELFVAISGGTVNGVDFINDAISNGAVAVVWEKLPGIDAIEFSWRKNDAGESIPVIAVEALSQRMGLIAERFYQYPSESISVCGVTGTNGKTSCAHFIAQMFSVYTRCGLLGTLGSGVYGELNETGFTTPDVISCHKWLAELVDKDIPYAVMEVSSHALVQGRVNNIHFETAVFTNLSRDHLDYHGDMQSYADAKAKLFDFPDLANAIINADDETGENIISRLRNNINVIRYGLNKENNPDVSASNVVLTHNGLQMHVITPWGDAEIVVPLIGRFNVSNILAVLSVLLVHGIEFDDAIKRLSMVESVPGRMQCITRESEPLVVVDYAHTPDALEQVLNALREHEGSNIWCVFGCGGDRDKGKRSLMGAIAENLSDMIVLTNDNPRNESPETIINEIKSGMKQPDSVKVEFDRKNAILFALKNAGKNDVVLIAGKGHERFQQIEDKKIPFSDIDVVLELFGECA